ncbi:hypothetical protein OB446_002960 [Paenibacillus alvei]|uniref:hypothetical protein n=1 Tax=Paenibacillus alvei TaxID=44250 RepID=UPI002DC0582C|nr:hypothetical protein [Paenibacillus alvei]
MSKTGTDSNTLYQMLINSDMLKLPEDLKLNVLNTIKDAWSSSFSTVFLTGLGFIVFGIFVALLIGNGRISREAMQKRKPGSTGEGSDDTLSAQPQASSN